MANNPVIKRGRPSLADAEQLSGRILDASWDVLLATGFESFTFDRVARHARIGKATIYSRFANKHDLMTALLKRRVSEQNGFIEAQALDLPPVEAFARRATEVLKTIGTPDGLLLDRLIDWLDQERLDGTTGTPGQGLDFRSQVYRFFLESIKKSLRESAERNALRIVDVDTAAQFWLEGILGHVRLTGAGLPTDSDAISNWAKAYTAFFFSAIEYMAEKG
ncbi:TetR/AcrR family transcriptional regulator [Novosphingobium sp.]|uniref:TetR/AcrR family transcriptional regulator n=1 Tax=Novosphingobium sp. TaxID=1874826 RepID=UPI0038BDD0E9